MEHVRAVTSLYRDIAYDFYLTGKQLWVWVKSLPLPQLPAITLPATLPTLPAFLAEYAALLSSIWTEIIEALETGEIPKFIFPATALIFFSSSVWMYILILYIA